MGKRLLLSAALAGAVLCGAASLVWAGGDEPEGEAPEKSEFGRPEPPQKFLDLEVPDLEDEDRIEDGKKLYLTNCQTCHGKEGKGDGPAGMALKPRAQDLTNPELQDAMTDQYIFWRISKGGAALGYAGMTAFEDVINEDDRWDLVAYLRTLKKKKPALPDVELLDAEAFEKLMGEDIKGTWSATRKAIRDEDAKVAAEEAKKLSEHVAKIPGCDLNVASGKAKGEKMRDQDDFKEWAKTFKEKADELAEHAEAEDWDKVTEAQKEVGQTCKSCHDVYKP